MPSPTYQQLKDLGPVQRLALLRQFDETHALRHVGLVDNVLAVVDFAYCMDVSWPWDYKGEYIGPGSDLMWMDTYSAIPGRFLEIWFGIWHATKQSRASNWYEVPEMGPGLHDEDDVREFFSNHPSRIMRCAYERVQGQVETDWILGRADALLRATEDENRENILDQANLEYELVWFKKPNGDTELGWLLNPIKPTTGRRSWRKTSEFLREANDDCSKPGEILIDYGSHRKYVLDSLELLKYAVWRSGVNFDRLFSMAMESVNFYLA